MVRYSVDLPTELYEQIKGLADNRGSTLAIEIKRAMAAHNHLYPLRETMTEAMVAGKTEKQTQGRMLVTLESGDKVPIELFAYIDRLIDGQDSLK